MNSNSKDTGVTAYTGLYTICICRDREKMIEGYENSITEAILNGSMYVGGHRADSNIECCIYLKKRQRKNVKKDRKKY